MGMAGYHLSCNKMLFFSGALFITLAIGIHLTPYFPFVTGFVTIVSSVVVFQNRHDSCLSHLHDLVWDVTHSPDSDPPPSITTSLASADSTPPISSTDLGSSLPATLRPGSSLTCCSLWFSIESEWTRLLLFKLYALNLTSLVAGFNRNRNYPDVLVMGSGLWHMHMFHFTNASCASLQSLRTHAAFLVSSSKQHEEVVTGSVLATERERTQKGKKKTLIFLG
ncbi:hypothetical protein RchiOBHm_Chr5g0027411 [Rosa chinensis]|uniref:Uncharacterized protein n=1 Tax=Rosa chinensis TaxID=74649 RepID=A0A2P6Q945_ROSCH|nr:hypothetical protein RchiOBHm_Chr5g0027411 [Rosa chinensis]